MNEIVVRQGNAADDAILRYVNSHSPEEISHMLNGIISPERVMSRTQELLKSRGWLTLQQRQTNNHLQLSALLAKLQERYLDLDTAKVILATIKELFKQNEALGRATDEDLNKLYGNQGAIMARVVDGALGYMRGALREHVPAELWDTLLEEAMAHARDEIAKHQDEVEA